MPQNPVREELMRRREVQAAEPQLGYPFKHRARRLSVAETEQQHDTFGL